MEPNGDPNTPQDKLASEASDITTDTVDEMPIESPITVPEVTMESPKPMSIPSQIDPQPVVTATEEVSMSEQPELVPPSSPTPLRGILVAAFFLIALLTVVAAYLFMQNQKLTSQLAPSPTPTASVVPETTLTQDQAANWKTFTNKQYMYTFKHPETWQIVDLLEGKSVEVYYQPDKEKPVGEILVEKLSKDPSNLSEFTGSIGVSAIHVSCMSDASNVKTWCYDSEKKLMITKIADKDPAYNETLDQILSTFKISEPEAKVPPSISKIFSNVNQVMGTQIAATEESQFYTAQGFVDKTSWKLDLTGVLTDKSKITVLTNALASNLSQDSAASADGVGQGVEGYQNDQIYCYFLRGLEKSDYLSCVEK